ncbi:putative rRNA methylase YtqB isoform X2 [Manihot esculenta]|uniref:putative rRNA methylase YtqB isoform X2 n=1 Tax=Manihot esculenta TaxID=3983 RepID=UPI000B5D2062|nr:putative rRNA methylase YtqB isoform X2 [Manihot esculenta]
MLGLRCFPQSNYLKRFYRRITINCLSNSIQPLPTSNLTLCFSSNLSSFSISISNIHQYRKLYATVTHTSNSNVTTSSTESPLTGLEDDLVGYVLGKKKATEVAHLVWKHVVQKGDTVIDATCGNGYDTLAMLKMVADESGTARVYGMDIQRDALENTSSLLDENVTPKELVKLFSICHSRIEEIIPENSPVRLVAFNLGYLPGGDKALTTVPETTMMAIESAKRVLVPGGLISLVVYVGHPGGREELETVESFASGLSVDEWICCKFQMLNRPLAPVLVFLFKK